MDAQKGVLNYFCKSEIKSKKLSLPSGILNYIEIQNQSVDSSSNKSTLVLTHGYGSGLGFFYANYDALCSQYDRVVAVDWLGMGASSRDANIAKPISRGACSTTSWCHGTTMAPTKAAEFFIDSLEELRVELGITSFVLAGHSLGGYLSGRYAHKYPNEIKGLVLISPVGVPAWPHKESIIPSSNMSFGYQLLNSAWKGNITPQSLIRIVGASKGGEVVRNILQRRFGKGKFNEKEVQLLSEYLYQISVAKPCGEFAMNSLLLPIISDQGGGTAAQSTSVFAHEPLEILFREGGALNIPSVLVMYGDHDWLRYPKIEQCLRRWERESGVAATYELIPQASHHLYLDNPGHFHRIMGQYKHSVYS